VIPAVHGGISAQRGASIVNARLNRVTFPALVAALVYAIVMTILVTPIVSAWGADYAVYLDTIQGGRFAEVVGLFLASGDLLSRLANAQLLIFYSIFVGLAKVGLEATASIALVSGVSAFIVALYTIVRSRNKLFLVFLLSPFVLDLLYFQIRNGFALSLFLVGLMIRSRARKLSYALFALAVLIHFSMILFVALYLVAGRVDRARTRAKDLATTLFLSKLGGIAIAALYLVSSISLHRYYVREGLFTESSMVGLLFFGSLAGVYVLAGQGFIRRYRFEFFLSIVLLWLYPVFAQAMRVFASSYPLHLTALSNMRKPALAFVVLFALFVFNVLQWEPLMSYLGL
jgi:hypothetical protein